MGIARLRNILLKSPSIETWKEILEFFDSVTNEDFELALVYAEQHLQTWPDEFRHIEDLGRPGDINILAFSPEMFPLVRSLRFYRQDVSELPRQLQELFVQSPSLTRLTLSCRELTSIRAIQPLKKLQFLELYRCNEMKDFHLLSVFVDLKELKISHCRQLKDIRFLHLLEKLEVLDLTESAVGRTCEDIKALTMLRELSLNYCQKLRSLEGLEGLFSLEKLSLFACTQLRDIQAIMELPRLSHINFGYSNIYEMNDSLPVSIRSISSRMQSRAQVSQYQKKLREHYQSEKDLNSV